MEEKRILVIDDEAVVKSTARLLEPEEFSAKIRLVGSLNPRLLENWLGKVRFRFTPRFLLVFSE